MSETEGIIRPATDEQAEPDIHYVRCFYGGNFALTFAWHAPLPAQKAHELIETRRKLWAMADAMGELPKENPVVDIGPDAFGSKHGVDVREVKATSLTSGKAMADMNYALQYADMLGKMRYSTRLEKNRELWAWMRRMMSAGQQIIHPGTGGMQ